MYAEEEAIVESPLVDVGAVLELLLLCLQAVGAQQADDGGQNLSHESWIFIRKQRKDTPLIALGRGFSDENH